MNNMNRYKSLGEVPVGILQALPRKPRESDGVWLHRINYKVYMDSQYTSQAE